MSWNKAAVFFRAAIKHSGRYCLYLAAFVCYLRAVMHAWVIEDAYITFRVIDNVVHGYGLRWNIDERVQVYTHPLWMILHIPFYALFGHIYLVTTLISAACCMLALWLLLSSVGSSYWHKLMLCALPLMFSTTFRDYAMCGLENPLGMALLAWFICELFWPAATFRYDRLCFAAALGMVNRLDSVAIVLPALVWGAWHNRHHWRWSKMLLAFSPLIGWLLFSLFYYGFFLPNTAYAKTGGDIPRLNYIGVGWKYMLSFIPYDPVGVLMFCISAVGALACLRRIKTFDIHSQRSKILALFLGICLNILYVIFVGGDYMVGRFCSNMVIASIAIGYVALRQYPKLALAAFGLIASAGMLETFPILEKYNPLYHPGAFYWYEWDYQKTHYPMLGFFSPENITKWKEPNGLELEESNPIMPREVRVDGRAGRGGFYANHSTIIIDSYGLCDALLARLPTITQDPSFSGHLERRIPEGYIHARQTDDLSQMEPSLAVYYGKLRLITSGALFSLERIETIAKFQLGWYDPMRDHYVHPQRP